MPARSAVQVALPSSFLAAAAAAAAATTTTTATVIPITAAAAAAAATTTTISALVDSLQQQQRQCLLFSSSFPASPYHHHALSSSGPRRGLSAAAAAAATRNRSNGAALLCCCGCRRRLFHTTAPRRDDVIDNARNHYETLKIAPTATAAEIKKAFYTLSKTHHPDLHEASARRAAAKRFMRISEAYSILSSPTKRAKYDREHLPAAHLSSSQHQSGKRGSYSSTGPAGGRPASGLSRRRGTFTGPPPSFYRSGGWGAQGAKRKAAHDESTGGFGTPGGQTSSTSSSSSSSSSNPTYTYSSSHGSRMGGMGPGQDPFGHGAEVPHFDRASHERTGRNHEERRRQARRRRSGVHDETGQRVEVEPEGGVAGMFFAIGGVLCLSFITPFFLGRLWYGSGASTTGGKLERKEKGSSSSSSSSSTSV